MMVKGPDGAGDHRPLSRRARRLRGTVCALAGVAVAGGAFLGYRHRAGQPAPYRPGEETADITRSLDRSLPRDAPEPRLADVTAEAGLEGFLQFRGERSSQLPEDMGSGAAWGDYDGDGDDDLFLVASGAPLDAPEAQRAPSQLYQNRGDGTFRKVEEFPETRIIGMAAAWGDYDGDGWLDLAVSGYGSLLLYHNREGRLEPGPRLETGPGPGFWAGVSWGDYDRDGDLDLYVCGYVQYQASDADRARASTQYGRSVPYTLNPASYRPERNLLFRNDGPRGFTEVAEQLKVENREGRSLAALWHDFDGDGWLDLYVANDISDNVLYLNRSGRFVDSSHAAWVADYRGAMGLAAGDWNRDGDDDLFVTHWVAQENALYDSQLAAGRPAAPAPGPAEASAAEPASPLRFVDVADQRGLGQSALRMVGWGTEFLDLDGDGWLDLAVANGSTFETEQAPRRLVPQASFLMWNQRGEYFHDLAPANPALTRERVSRGLAVSDYDQDGDLDLVLVNHGEGVLLLRNDMQKGHALELRLRHRLPGGKAWGLGDGAQVVVHLGELALRRAVTGASYLSQSTRTLHFGLGEATRVDRVDVRWPDGEWASYPGLEAGSLWELRQGESEAARVLRFASPPPGHATAGPGAGGAVPAALPKDPRERTLAFWNAQRAAMDAMKVEKDRARAIGLFREALALRPDHEDSLYYLASCLASEGDAAGAIGSLEELVRVNPQSHRGFRQLGILRAREATSPQALEPARQALERAVAINPEETGALLALGEVSILEGDRRAAATSLEWATRSNPRAVGGFFLRGYLAWLEGDQEAARSLLEQARKAAGPEWKPEGTTAEGDTRRVLHDDDTPLSRYWRAWDGGADPGSAFAALARGLGAPRGATAPGRP